MPGEILEYRNIRTDLSGKNRRADSPAVMPRGGPAAEPMHGQHRAVNPVRVCRDRLYTHGAACITAVMPSEGPAGVAAALFINTV